MPDMQIGECFKPGVFHSLLSAQRTSSQTRQWRHPAADWKTAMA